MCLKVLLGRGDTTIMGLSPPEAPRSLAAPMNNKHQGAWIAAAVFLLFGCSTKQVTPVAKLDEKRVCIVQSAGSGAGNFAEAYRKALEERGYHAEVFMETAQPSICPVTTR